MADITDPNDPARRAYLAEGNARQARKRVATNVLVQDSRGRVLLVNPTYKAHWDLPGGMAEANEPPRAAAARELREELDLTVPVGRLLLVTWVGPKDPWDDQLVFVFDGGALADGASQLTVSDPEISAYQFATMDDAAEMLRADVNERLRRAHAALLAGTVDYHETERDW